MPRARVTVVPLLDPRPDPLLAVVPVVRPALEPEAWVDDEPDAPGFEDAAALDPGAALDPVPAALPLALEEPPERLDVVLAPEDFSAVIVKVMPGCMVKVLESLDALALLDPLEPVDEPDEAVDPPDIGEPEPDVPVAGLDVPLPLEPIAFDNTILQGALAEALVLELPPGELLV